MAKRELPNKIGYMSRQRNVINAVEWTKLRSNPDYSTIRTYDGNNLSIDVRWVGKLTQCDVEPPAYWCPFKVDVFNLISTGDRPGTYDTKKVADSQLTIKCMSEEGALIHYTQILIDKGLLEQNEKWEVGAEDQRCQG
ncbi:MAG: hypothetical protein RL707_1652 [Pseudomonadota bacterium]